MNKNQNETDFKLRGDAVLEYLKVMQMGVIEMNVSLSTVFLSHTKFVYSQAVRVSVWRTRPA